MSDLSLQPEPGSLGPQFAFAAVEEGAARYFEERRRRIDIFVEAHFSLRGTLALHRAAVGWDIVKAPVNLALAVPQVGMHLCAKLATLVGARRFAKLLLRPILLETAVMRELNWLLHTELFELPIDQKKRRSTRDALSETILDGAAVQEAVAAALIEIGRHGDDPAFRERLARAMATYGMTRSAAAEITTGLVNLGAGAILFNKLTPGAATLGPALAAIMAHQTAVSAFPLGAWLGGSWYVMFPVHPSSRAVATSVAGLMLASSFLAAFAGIASDPLQRAMGLHRARLLRVIDSLERQFLDPGQAGFRARDHYVARLLDVFDILGSALQLTRV